MAAGRRHEEGQSSIGGAEVGTIHHSTLTGWAGNGCLPGPADRLRDGSSHRCNGPQRKPCELVRRPVGSDVHESGNETTP